MPKKNRGPAPSPTTIMKLVVASGGRCQFEGCNRNLFRDDITWKEFNNSNIAHIVASSPDGPRGSEKSHELSDKLENLMLMCPTHHKEIDSDVDIYTVEKLTEIKQKQEQKVQELLDGMNFPDSEIVILESPIKGKTDVHVDKKQAVEALRNQSKNPASTHPTLLKVDSYGDYTSSTYWQCISEKLKAAVEKLMTGNLQYYPELMLAVFPIAPIPLIAKLGELLGDKRVIDIFQKSREPDTWCWRSEEVTNTFVCDEIEDSSGDSDKTAIILSLTARVAVERVMPVFKASKIYHIYAERTGVDCIASRKDLRLFWQKYHQVCDQIKNVDHQDSAAVFSAIPVSAAFEVGRRHMPGVHPVLHIYEDDNGFFEALTIGGP